MRRNKLLPKLPVIEVIFEDDSLLILSKPSGQTVNRSPTTKSEVTLQDELEDYFSLQPGFAGVGGRAGIVHRLDKGTSGVLVVAKTEEAFKYMQEQFRKRMVEKEYLSLVHGEAEREGEINAPIARHPKVRVRFAVVEGGRESFTSFRREKVFKRERELYSFIRVFPKTGRTHQIRVHMSHINHPIVSDNLYLSKRKLDEDLEFCPRLFLHAASLSFVHPQSKARVRFDVDLPPDLQRVIDLLQA